MAYGILWTKGVEERRRLEAFLDYKKIRRLVTINWIDQVTNAEVNEYKVLKKLEDLIVHT